MISQSIIYCHDHSILYFNFVIPSDLTINFILSETKFNTRPIKLGLNLGFIVNRIRPNNYFIIYL